MISAPLYLSPNTVAANIPGILELYRDSIPKMNWCSVLLFFSADMVGC